MENIVTHRSGTVLVRANKTDPEFTVFIVRQIDDCYEYYHRQFGKWFSVPDEWLAEIVWN